MFKNKIKYSLLVGSLYNVKCDFTFKAYIDGEEINKKTLNFDEIKKYKEEGINISGKNIKSGNIKSFNEMLKTNSNYDFADYIQNIVFYCLKNNIYCAPLAGTEFVKAKFDGNETKVDFKGFETYKDNKITVNFYYLTRVKYVIINKDEILKLENYYDHEKWEEIKNSLEFFSKKNKKLTYNEIKNNLKWFKVEIASKDGKMHPIDFFKLDSYITEDESKNIKLLENKKYRIPKKIKIKFNDNKEIEIESYKDITIKDLCDIYEDSNDSVALENGYFKFSDKNGKELTDNDLVQDNMSCENIKYKVAIYKCDKNGKENVIENYTVVNDFSEKINFYKAKGEYKDYKFEVYRGYSDESYDDKNDSYKNYLDYRIVIVLREQGENHKSDEHKVEESIEKPIEKPTEKKTIETPIEEEPKGEEHKSTDSEVVKKTALINECNKLVNEIKALDSSYDKTIKDSASVENLENLKNELTNKLNELKNKEPKDKEVPENPNPKNTEPTSTDEGNTEKNKNKCGNCCCKNKK